MAAADGNIGLPAIPGCEAPFSRPSAFGLFLTLAFCLLTQPQGSLLYPPSSKAPGLTLALLRLYPPYCLAETAVMIIYLTRSLWCAWGEGHRPKWQVTSANKWYQTRLSLNLGPFTPRIRMTAIALLSVRSREQAKLVAALRAQTLSKETELAATPHHSTRPGQATATGTDPTPGTLPRRRTTKVEEGNLLETSQSESPREETIMSTVNPDVLAHGQLQVDVVTLVSVLTIMTKLAVSTLPGTIRFTAWPLVIGWIGLHAVLLIFHSGGDDGINSVDSAALIRELRTIEADLNDLPARAGVMVVLFFINFSCGLYVFQRLANEIYIPEELLSDPLEFGLVYFPVLFVSILVGPLLGVLGVGLLVVRLIAICSSPPYYGSKHLAIGGEGTSLLVFSSFWGLMAVIYIWWSQELAWFSGRLGPVFGGLLRVGYAGGMSAMMDLLHFLDVPYFGDLFVKTFALGVGFYGMVMLYNVQETCKPGWLDYLG